MLKKLINKQVEAVCASLRLEINFQKHAPFKLRDYASFDRARGLKTALNNRISSNNVLWTDGGNPEVPTDPYAEDTPLTWVFGNHSEAKLVATFLSEPDTTMDLHDIERLSGVEDDDVEEKLVRLENLGVVSCEWSNETGVTCSLNSGTEPVEQLQRTEEALLKYWYRN